ncbi:MAG: phosphotyrosine protein phosphatase [Planctomycetota bacterium]|nr:phosphotyrosine protein phosphatase [Planctomycetota bacterium]
MSATKVLFICSRNQWRSPTGERVLKSHPDYQTRSAGTSPKARNTVNASMIQWADVIFVMENKHQDRLQARFSKLLKHKPLHVLDIPDEYQFMDPELVSIFEDCLFDYLGKED